MAILIIGRIEESLYSDISNFLWLNTMRSVEIYALVCIKLHLYTAKRNVVGEHVINQYILSNNCVWHFNVRACILTFKWHSSATVKIPNIVQWTVLQEFVFIRVQMLPTYTSY
jgi:hypothetical protein